MVNLAEDDAEADIAGALKAMKLNAHTKRVVFANENLDPSGEDSQHGKEFEVRTGSAIESQPLRQDERIVNRMADLAERYEEKQL